jgi:hypothetical protein
MNIMGIVACCALLGFVLVFVWLIGTALSLAIRPWR